jgi:hypothetical protein
VKYILNNDKLPTNCNKDIKISALRHWFSTQKDSYKSREYIMKNDIIYNKFKDFIEMYKEYLLSNEEIWDNNLKKVINYINENKKIPSRSEDIKISNWIRTQNGNFKKRFKIMKNEEIYNKWTNFINDDKYKEYFLDNDIIWNNNLVNVKKYIDDNNKRPSKHDKSIEIKNLGSWVSAQQNNYKTKSHIMSSEEIYNKWTDFINDDKYKEYFLDNDIVWSNTLEKVKNYIDDNKKRPPGCGKDKEIKTLGKWISTQQNKYKTRKEIMKTEEVYNKWTDFINDDVYKSYFSKDDEEQL